MAFDWVKGRRGIELSCGSKSAGQNVVLVGTEQERHKKLIEMLDGKFLTGQALIDVQYLQGRLNHRGSPGRKTERPVRLGRIKR